MKVKLKLLFIIAIMIACMLPVFTMPFFAETESAEKRELSSAPVLYSEEDGLNKEYTSELNTYLSEHFSFRSELVTACNYIIAKVFGASNQDSIVIGSEDWLYFADTLPDYTGSGRFTEEELRVAIKVLDLINEGVSDCGARFVFAVAPNKNTVYPEHMPYYISKSTLPSNYDMLNDKLSERAYYVNVLPELKANDMQLYHKRDSHWNNMGANICFDKIMKVLSRDSIDYVSEGYTIQKTWRGDLDDMIFPKLGYTDEQVEFNFTPSFEFTSSFNTVDAIKAETYCSSGEGKLLMIRDSFANALVQFFSQEYEYAEYTKILPCRLNGLQNGGYDTVVLELAERNIPELIKSAPVMQAPRREDIAPVNAEVEGYLRDSNDMLHVYGTVNEFSENIYIEVDNGNKIEYYAAFPICETELLEAENNVNADGKFGFSAYLPYSTSDNIKIRIVKDGNENG